MNYCGRRSNGTMPPCAQPGVLIPWSLLLVPVLLRESTVYAFDVRSSTSRHSRQSWRTVLRHGDDRPTMWTTRLSPLLFGTKKTPPKDLFDLDAIEALEQELLLQESLVGFEDADETTLEDDDDEDLGDTDKSRTTLVVPLELNSQRIDAVLSRLLPNNLSRSFCGSLVDEGRVYCRAEDDNEVATARLLIDKKSYKVQSGQHLQVQVRPSNANLVSHIVPQDLPLDILFEDAHLIVLNKAAHMVVHPGAGHTNGTIVHALAHYLTQHSPWGSGDLIGTSIRPGIVHRLDKGTTGVLVVGKTLTAQSALSEMFASRQAQKTYLCIAVGNPGQDVMIDKPIGRHPIHRQRMRVVPEVHRDSPTVSRAGRRAISYVDTLAFDGKLSLVQVRIVTGRTHQIRVHLQDRHTPIYGDPIYGLSDWNQQLYKTSMDLKDRPLLHAYQLQLRHPITHESMNFTAPLPADLLRIARIVYPQGPNERPDLFPTPLSTT